MELYDNLVRKHGNVSEEEWKAYANYYIGHSQDIDESLSITIKRNAFIDGFKCAKEKLEIEYFERFKEARQEDKEKLIAEACRYLEENMDKDLVIYNNHTWKSREIFINNFRKAMEELK